jgi:hypothetical protein
VVQVRVNGQVVTVDARTLTIGERQAMKRELAQLGYEPDDLDALCATIWVVMHRDDASLTFAEVCDSLTLEDLSEAGSDLDGDSPES